MEKRHQVLATITITIAEIVTIISFFDVFTPIINNPTFSNLLSLMLPSGLVYLVNYYILAPIAVWLFYWCQDILGFKGLVKRIDLVIDDAVQWFDNMQVKWAPYETATNFEKEHRIANMFEVVISMRETERHKKKPKLYENRMNYLLSASSEYGWYSRSLGTELGNETVVCTSLGLYAFAFQIDTLNDKARQKLERIAVRLWEHRTENGWGVFLKKHHPSECRMANTFWALRSLSFYFVRSNLHEYTRYVVSIYEKSTNSLFGYHPNDIRSLCVTAMYLLLYWELPECVQKEVERVYEPRKAVKYIHKRFCQENVQCESEDLPGIEKVDKVPWQHITVSYVSVP